MVNSALKSGAGILRKIAESIIGPLNVSNMIGWIAIIVLIMFIKGCVVDQYTIPTGSMDPTLKGDPRFFRGDRVLVNKCRFGVRIPFTTKRIWTWERPDRWDIVVFRSVDPNAEHPILIKRVIGLPGERVKIKDEKIFINGEEAIPPEGIRDVLHYYTELKITEIEEKRQFLSVAKNNKSIPILNPYHPPVMVFYREMSRIHEIVKKMDISSLSDEEVRNLCSDVEPEAIKMIGDIYEFSQPSMPYGIRDEDEFSVVPEGHYFLLGDNSAASLDGRMYGWVPENNLYGSAFAVWWPWARRKDLTGFSHTWWGALLLYGIPVMLVSWEIIGYYRRRKRNTPTKE